ncbi:hypothetical protein ABPG75_007379 [Micractinium tetrahymenae]
MDPMFEAALHQLQAYVRSGRPVRTLHEAEPLQVATQQLNILAGPGTGEARELMRCLLGREVRQAVEPLGRRIAQGIATCSIHPGAALRQLLGLQRLYGRVAANPSKESDVLLASCAATVLPLLPPAADILLAQHAQRMRRAPSTGRPGQPAVQGAFASGASHGGLLLLISLAFYCTALKRPGDRLRQMGALTGADHLLGCVEAVLATILDDAWFNDEGPIKNPGALLAEVVTTHESAAPELRRAAEAWDAPRQRRCMLRGLLQRQAVRQLPAEERLAALLLAVQASVHSMLLLTDNDAPPRQQAAPNRARRKAAAAAAAAAAGAAPVAGALEMAGAIFNVLPLAVTGLASLLGSLDEQQRQPEQERGAAAAALTSRGGADVAHTLCQLGGLLRAAGTLLGQDGLQARLQPCTQLCAASEPLLHLVWWAQQQQHSLPCACAACELSGDTQSAMHSAACCASALLRTAVIKHLHSSKGALPGCCPPALTEQQAAALLRLSVTACKLAHALASVPAEPGDPLQAAHGSRSGTPTGDTDSSSSSSSSAGSCAGSCADSYASCTSGAGSASASVCGDGGGGIRSSRAACDSQCVPCQLSQVLTSLLSFMEQWASCLDASSSPGCSAAC